MAGMTGVLTRPLLRDRGDRGREQNPRELRPPVVGGLLAAGWAALAGSLICGAVAVIGWFTASGGTAHAALRLGIDAWLLAHRVPIQLTDGQFALPPLGLSILPLALLYHAGKWVGRTCVFRDRTDLAIGAGAIALGYAGLAELLALLARTQGAEPHLGWAAAATGAAALIAGSGGLLAGSGRIGRAWAKLPEEVRAATTGGAAALAALVLAGAVALATALATNFGRVITLAEALNAGVLGGVLLLLAGLTYVPNAVVFAAAFLAGPGFAVGAGTTVSTTGVTLGPLPAFPLLAALPTPGEQPGWTYGLLALPFLAGLAGGVIAVRRNPVDTVDRAAIRGAIAGATGGLAFAALATIAGGAAGPGRLSTVGPPPLETALLVTVTFALAAAVAAAATTGWTLWRDAKR
jgi:hypothetical protein